MRNKKILKGTKQKDTRCTILQLLSILALTLSLGASSVSADPAETSAATQAQSQDFTSSENTAETAAGVGNNEEKSAAGFTSSVVITGQDVADFACQYVGNPYVWAGTSLTNGADCSGFVLSVYANFGIELPHYAASQAAYGTAVEYADLRPGDLLFYSWGGEISHVAIYIGDGKIVHAMNEASGICISQADYSPVVCCRRLV